jgi:hypothetical protein
VVTASGAVFLAALVAGLVTVAAVLAMPAVHAGTSGGEGPDQVLADAEDTTQ